MQTRFSPEQLRDPAIQSSEKILRTCVHCGFCTATCPTYLLLGDELDSPRGRIYLIKDMLENGRPATPQVVKHIDRCLSCLSCMTTCPSGVHYMHLVDHARSYIEATYERPWHDRLLRRVLGALLPHPTRFRFALLAAYFGRPLKPLLRPIPAVGARLAAMLDLAPSRIEPRSTMEGPAAFAPTAPKRARVALLSGCAQPVLKPSINDATIRLLNRLGVEVVLPKGEGCCGALVHHMGRDHDSHAYAARNVEAWVREMDGDGLDAIVITASGCGTTIKDYGFMFRDDPAMAQKAARVSALAMDVTEYLATLDLPAPARTTGQVVAYHSACSMQHGQKITDLPKTLLKAAGFTVKDVPEGHICCGSAGVYNILQPEIAGQLRERKVANIARTRPQVIATGNIGCIQQIGKGLADAGSPTPIVHTVELLDWAHGGPMPDAMEEAGLADTPVRAPAVTAE
ncbi:MAG: glycolate oxidase subunit GlcF [Burkholderiales bacterium]|nr:glycolate oxidase subunit GlcF [Burkholderiales bacterium]